MSKNHRPKRLGEEIKKLISQLLTRGELKDPGLQGRITLSAVEVSSDGHYATVFLMPPEGDGEEASMEEDKAQLLAAFEKSKGFIRSELARVIQIRHVPELRFKIDQAAEYGKKMDQLFAQLGTADKAKPEEAE